MDEIITRDTATRLSRSKHVFLRENPHLRKLFKKLQKERIRTVDDIKDKKIKNKIKNIMIKTEVTWRFNSGDIPYLTFSNHAPMQGDFGKAIPKILKELEKLVKKDGTKS